MLHFHRERPAVPDARHHQSLRLQLLESHHSNDAAKHFRKQAAHHLLSSRRETQSWNSLRGGLFSFMRHMRKLPRGTLVPPNGEIMEQQLHVMVQSLLYHTHQFPVLQALTPPRRSAPLSGGLRALSCSPCQIHIAAVTHQITIKH